MFFLIVYQSYEGVLRMIMKDSLQRNAVCVQDLMSVVASETRPLG